MSYVLYARPLEGVKTHKHPKLLDTRENQGQCELQDKGENMFYALHAVYRNPGSLKSYLESRK
jgi:hypothetical protein